MGVFEENEEAITSTITKVIMGEGPHLRDHEGNEIKTQTSCIAYLADVYNVAPNSPYKWWAKVANNLTSPTQASQERKKAFKVQAEKTSSNCLDIISDTSSTPQEVEAAKETIKALQLAVGVELKISKLRF